VTFVQSKKLLYQVWMVARASLRALRVAIAGAKDALRCRTDTSIVRVAARGLLDRRRYVKYTALRKSHIRHM
jgi:cytidylate kinase